MGRPRKDLEYKSVRVPIELRDLLAAKSQFLATSDGKGISAYELFGSLVIGWAKGGITKRKCQSIEPFLISYPRDGDYGYAWLEQSVYELLKESAVRCHQDYPDIRGATFKGVLTSNLAWAIIMSHYSGEDCVKRILSEFAV
jgi:hypothetical protein